ncbi:sugar ABC transporter permease [Ruminococcaceae bacterium OttesenSCG-928-I18]|nr:sugar ABC transporter permease [Ruminococcaceae bacterium OttesenSCG-928-I18]
MRQERKRKQPYGREGRVAAWFLLPSLAGTLLFFLLPFIDTVRRSFFSAKGTRFEGLSLYRSVLQNDAFQLASANTAKFIAVCIPLLLLASLLAAFLMRAIRPAGRWFKTGLLLPMAVPVASVVVVWKVLFHEKGLINAFLLENGFSAVDFMGTDAAFWVLILTYLWKNIGYDMILWLVGLDGIPHRQYEAAAVDGAGVWRTFLHVTLPGLMPTFGLVAILSLLNSFKVFREAYLVAGPYPHESIYLLQHLFNNWFVNLDIGRLCAAATILCTVLLCIILAIQRYFKEED